MFVYTVGCTIKALNLDTWVCFHTDLTIYKNNTDTLDFVAVQSKFHNYVV